MNLLAGLEKFGIKMDKVDNLFEEEKEEKKDSVQEKKAPVIPKESDYLLLKTVRCPVCDKTFKTKVVKSGKTKRLMPDDDLRPRHEHIDTLKYEVSSCPFCGYTSMNRYFSHISPTQIKLIREGVCSQIKIDPNTAKQEADDSPYDYDTAIEMYKLAIFNTMVKKGKNSEKAYECLKISWLYRGKIEKMKNDTPEAVDNIKANEKEEQVFYEQAYEGFQKAIASEMFPMCGMDESTMDLLIAAMAFRLEKYEVASKFVSSIISSHVANANTKRRAVDMKQEILEAIKKSKGEA